MSARGAREAPGGKFVCEYCLKSHPNLIKLHRHQRISSCAARKPGASTWRCQQCYREFKSNYLYRCHQKDSACSGAKWQCSRCKMETPCKRTVTRHIKNGICSEACDSCLEAGNVYSCSLAKSTGPCSNCIHLSVECIKSDTAEGAHPVQISQSRHTLGETQEQSLAVAPSEGGAASDGYSIDQHNCWAADQAGTSLPIHDHPPGIPAFFEEEYPAVLPPQLHQTGAPAVFDYHPGFINDTHTTTSPHDPTLQSSFLGYQTGYQDQGEEANHPLNWHNQGFHSYDNSTLSQPTPDYLSESYTSYEVYSSSLLPVPEAQHVFSSSVPQVPYYDNDGNQQSTLNLSSGEEYYPATSDAFMGAPFSTGPYAEPEDYFNHKPGSPFSSFFG